jgi:dihydrofolate reductase
MITLIAAVAQNGVIGNQNTIPWRVPADFKHFSATTTGHAVIMGRSTLDSLPPAFRPLPKRTNIVLTRTVGCAAENGVHWVSDIDEAIRVAREIHGQDEIFIIGGASVYEQTIDRADRLLISEIPMEPEGDTFFPRIGPEWAIEEKTPMDGFTLVNYRRLT